MLSIKHRQAPSPICWAAPYTRLMCGFFTKMCGRNCARTAEVSKWLAEQLSRLVLELFVEASTPAGPSVAVPAVLGALLTHIYFTAVTSLPCTQCTPGVLAAQAAPRWACRALFSTLPLSYMASFPNSSICACPGARLSNILYRHAMPLHNNMKAPEHTCRNDRISKGCSAYCSTCANANTQYLSTNYLQMQPSCAA